VCVCISLPSLCHSFWLITLTREEREREREREREKREKEKEREDKGVGRLFLSLYDIIMITPFRVWDF